mgnify:CR=1 FL=1
MDAKLIEELRQKYSKNPPEGMTSNLVKNMTDSDLLDMHYFLTDDDDLDDDEFEEGFYIDFFSRQTSWTSGMPLNTQGMMPASQ